MAIGIRAGTLNRVVTLERGVPSASSEGDALLSYSPIGNYHANIAPASTQEVMLAAQRGQEITHVVTMRYQRGFPPVSELRIRYVGRTFIAVGAIDPDEDHIVLQIKAREETAVPTFTGVAALTLANLTVVATTS